MEEKEGKKDVEIKIAGKSIIGHLSKVPVADIKLDVNNVRFNHKPGISQAQMEAEILKERDTTTLCHQIEYDGGLHEYIIIDTNNVVREGNRRLVCIKKLHREAFNDEEKAKWSNIYALRLPPETKEMDIALYLGSTHVTGKKEWRAFNQAFHVYSLHETYEMSYDDMAKALGKGKITIINMCKAFIEHKKYSEMYPKDKEWVNKFSYFYEFLKNRKLGPWNKSPGWLSKFSGWVATGKIKKGALVRELPNVLKNKEALAALEKYGMDEAIKIVQKENPEIGDSLYKRMERIKDDIYHFSTYDIKEIASNSAKKKAFLDLRTKLTEIIDAVNEMERDRK